VSRGTKFDRCVPKGIVSGTSRVAFSISIGGDTGGDSIGIEVTNKVLGK
jgi:hypothetical protein